MKKKFLLSTLILLMLQSSGQISTLRQEILAIISQKRATVGIAIRLMETGDTLTVNGATQFPMQSVYKYHLALAVLDRVQARKLRGNQPVFISKKDLLPNTWSPIRDKYPEGEVVLPLLELIRYTVSESDNNGCDILFRLLGGPGAVHDYFMQKGLDEISIRATEEEMHADWYVQYSNWTTPRSALNVLDQFMNRKLISDSCYQQLWNFMLETKTGQARLKGLLPEGTPVAHKTGSSGSNPKGMTAATNDIGIICLPDGRHLEIAVFIKDSFESNLENEKIIAEIALSAYSHFTH